jgi:hypothetical protein
MRGYRCDYVRVTLVTAIPHTYEWRCLAQEDPAGVGRRETKQGAALVDRIRANCQYGFIPLCANYDAAQ